MDVEAYVNQALSRNIFFDTVREVKENTQGVEGEELDAVIDDAIAAVRAESVVRVEQTLSKAAVHAQNHGVTDKTIDAAVDAAMKVIRRR